jgi:four helix bundle protein
MELREKGAVVGWQERAIGIWTCGGRRWILYGLTSQLQRATVSIPANIAEGQGRQHEREFLQHLAIAYGSLAEVETHVQIARRLEYVDGERENPMLERAARIGRMLNGLRKSLEEKITVR